MGQRGPVAKKNPQGHDRGAAGNVVAVMEHDDKPRMIPTPPKDLSDALVPAWRDYWNSDVALTERPEQLPAVVRLFRLREQFERAMGVGSDVLAVKGSTGQIRTNPILEYALKLDAAIGRLETELGLTPMARARLGLTVGQAALTVEQLNAMTTGGTSPVLDLDDPELAQWQMA